MIAWARPYDLPGLRAYSVRPDLWPPGWVVSTSNGDVAEWDSMVLCGELVDYANMALDAGLDVPGVVESLILGDHPIDAWPCEFGWTPCAAPEVHEYA